MPGDEGEAAYSVPKDAKSAKGAAGLGSESINVNSPSKGGSKENT